jgi:hypothetical protein
MTQVLVAVMVLIFLFVAVPFLYRDVYLPRQVWKLAKRKFSVVDALMKKLTREESVSGDEIMMLAKDPALRCGLFHVLESTGTLGLFPAEYYSQSQAAEGYLVNWLEFPTELGAAPHEIELLTAVSIYEAETLIYYVFKFCTSGFFSAARKIWMLGVAGPYGKESPPYEIPVRVFSRFHVLGDNTPEEEVTWVHENIHSK